MLIVICQRAVCKELLQRILPDLDIDRVEYSELQKAIKEDYDTLNNSYIIFICLSDLFGKGRDIYNIESVFRLCGRSSIGRCICEEA